MFDFIKELFGVYLLLGAYMTVLYTAYVGKLISKKYECGFLEGCCRFILAGSVLSNAKAMIVLTLTWPCMFVAAVKGVWGESLTKMVDENDYDY